MKTKILLLCIIIAGLSSCSISYKTMQTPDDVYYSPTRLQNDRVRTDNDRDITNSQEVQPDYNNPEDREIRRRVHNRRYRRYDNRYNYPYGYDDGYYNNYPPVYSKSGALQSTSQPRKVNLGAYENNTSDKNSTIENNSKFGSKSNTNNTNYPVRTFAKPSANGSGVGNFIRRAFTGSNTNDSYNPGNSSGSSSSRSFDKSSNNNSSVNSNNSNSSSGNKSNSSAPVRAFKNN